MVEQPRYGTALHLEDLPGDDIVRHFRRVFGNRLENFGLMKPPYAFYDGVKPPEDQ